MISNPFDDIGVEEALRQKEKHGGEVVVVSIGAKEATKKSARRPWVQTEFCSERNSSMGKDPPGPGC